MLEHLAYGAALIGNVIYVAIIAGTGFFLFRSSKDGYWGKRGEDIKYQIFEDEPERKTHG